MRDNLARLEKEKSMKDNLSRLEKEKSMKDNLARLEKEQKMRDNLKALEAESSDRKIAHMKSNLARLENESSHNSHNSHNSSSSNNNNHHHHHSSSSNSSDEGPKENVDHGNSESAPSQQQAPARKPGLTRVNSSILGRADEETLLAALKDGADPNSVTHLGISYLSEACRLSETAIVKILLDHKADPNQRNPVGTYALHEAAGANKERAEIAKMLLEHGAHCDAVDDSGRTALHISVGSEYLDIAKLLIETGNASLDIQDKRGETALHLAAALGSKRVIRYLLSKGAKDNIPNSEGKTAADMGAKA